MVRSSGPEHKIKWKLDFPKKDLQFQRYHFGSVVANLKGQLLARLEIRVDHDQVDDL